MKLTREELEFLSAWAREEWELACYQLPAHRLQLAHDVPGAHLITLIKAWAEAEGKKDQAILAAATNSQPAWPWSTLEEFAVRLAEANTGLGRIGFAPDHQVFTTAEVLAFVKEVSKG
jgi:hypothetical protein